MDGTKLQAKVYGGYGKAAQRIGLPFVVYHPSGATNPLDSGNVTVTVDAHFTANGGYNKPNTYGQATWFAMVDGSKIAVGDYLVGTPGTFFIAARQPLLPILSVSCPRILSITQGGSTPVAVGWPASVLQESTRGEMAIEEIAGNPSNPTWTCLLPAIDSLMLGVADLVTDDLLRAYIINSAELTDLGWRISMRQSRLLTNSVVQHYATVIRLIGKVITIRKVTTITGIKPATNPIMGTVTVNANTFTGASTIVLKPPAGVGTLVLAGDKFTIAGSTTVYTVTTQATAAAGATLSVSFTPALTHDAAAGAVASFTWKNDITVKALVSGYDAKLIDGSVITIKDLRVLIGTTDTAGNAIVMPVTGVDQIGFDGPSGAFRSIGLTVPQYAGDTIAVYEVQAKG